MATVAVCASAARSVFVAPPRRFRNARRAHFSATRLAAVIAPHASHFALNPWNAVENATEAKTPPYPPRAGAYARVK